MPIPSYPRSGVTVADPDASLLGPVVVAPAQQFRLGAVGDTLGTTLTLSVFFLTDGLQPLYAQQVQFTAGSNPDWGKLFVGRTAIDPCWPLAGIKAIIVKVDAVSGGTWSYDTKTA